MSTKETLSVIILAAGKGTRMHSAIPKVLHKLAGKPLLKHVIDTAKKLSPKRICVVYGHGGESVPQAFRDQDLAFVKQEPQHGTGHAVQSALPYIDEQGKTLVLYGDVPLIALTTLEKLTNGKGELHLLTMLLNEPHGYGRIVRNDSGTIQKIVEEKDASPAERRIEEVNTGILIAENAKLKRWVGQLKNENAQGEYYLTDIIALAAQDGGKIDSDAPAEKWEVMGINDQSQLADLERIFQLEQARKLLTQGIAIADPARFDVRGNLVCGRDVYIDVNCIFEGEVKIGSNVRIGANSLIKDAQIADGADIAPFSHIEGANIGKGSRVGPFARLRPGTVLKNDVHIGNFVEIKNSEIEDKSKANHLSYIGDATVGKNVNIGAGTITCNYDGANKHRTNIEDDAFIGSDTQLIAPVTVAKGATIGAGSTIARNAPEGGLTLSRSKQVHISHWKRPAKKKE